ncbi:YfiR family protein [Candidatus Bathyarchaeota archaeon]|nr:YfiR family protein [Candidatus Bathyarchaeota archaeon]
MRIKPYILLLMLFFLTLVVAPQVRADSEKSKEYQIKAAFLYNFMKFVEWPAEKMGDANDPIVIGLIGSKDFIKALDPVVQKKINNKNITLKYFAGYEKLKKPQESDEQQWTQKMEALKSCHLLMFCSYDSVPVEATREITKALRDSPVLTVGEVDDFLESGGMVNFLMEDKKVHFEINYVAAKRGKLKISSQLLRLAKRVIEEDEAKEAKD